MTRWASRSARHWALLACLAGSSACRSSDAAAKSHDAQERSEVALIIDGMACESCASRIEKELRDIDGVHQATVEFATTQARIVYDPARASDTSLRDAVVALGFESRIAPRRD